MHGPKSECPSRTPTVAERSDRKRRCVRMKVLIGVDPHKASVAVAVVDEALGELVECATFLQNRAGLRALERWAKRFGERRWAVENAGGLGKHLSQRLAAARGWLRRSCATSGHWSERSRTSMGASKPRSKLPLPAS